MTFKWGAVQTVPTDVKIWRVDKAVSRSIPNELRFSQGEAQFSSLNATRSRISDLYLYRLLVCKSCGIRRSVLSWTASRWGCLGSGRGCWRWRWLLLIFQHLQTQLQLHDPLLFIIRPELAGMNANLLLTVFLELLRKGHHLSLKLLIRSNFSDLFLTVTIWAGSCWCWSLLLLFALNWLRLLLSVPAWPNLCRSFLLTWLGRLRPICISSCRLTSSSAFFNWRFTWTRSLSFCRLRFRRWFTLGRIGSLDNLASFLLLLIRIFLLTFAFLSFLLFLPLWLHDVIHQVV